MLKYRCLMCNRLTEPAMMLGKHAVGPWCAKKAGLVVVKRKNNTIKIGKKPALKDTDTLDLFADVL